MYGCAYVHWQCKYIYKRINRHFVSQTCLNAASFDSNGGLWNFGDVEGETQTTVIVER